MAASGQRRCERLNGFGVARPGNNVEIVVVRSWDHKDLLGLVGGVKKLLAMPERNHAVVGAVNDQHWAVDVADFLVVGKLVEGQKWDSRENAQSRDKGTLQDQRRYRLARG